jgi:Glycosyl transferase family 2
MGGSTSAEQGVQILMIWGGGVRLKPAGICERPRVSVVIPCYYGRYLEGCVRSALEQPGIDVYVTVIDDASLDNSHEVAQFWRRQTRG